MVASTTSVTLRHEIYAADVEPLRAIIAATERFYPAEVDVAVELLQDRLARGAASDYFFIVAELDGRVVGYACYGPIACTVSSYDLYWIAVDPKLQGRGIGQLILREVESRIAAKGGTHVFLDTSSRADYAPTRAFYLRMGYLAEAQLCDFYAPGDNKVIFSRRLVSPT